MHTIIRGVESINKLLSTKYSDNKQYIPSAYVLRYEIDNILLLCNTMTGEVALLSESEKELFNNLPLNTSNDSQNLAGLLYHGFVVPNTCDEAKRCDQLKSVFLHKDAAKGIINNYNILPTTGCNARCFYCYESNIKHINMSDDTASCLVDFIANHHGDKKVNISWFGGEPTLGVRQINYISDKLSQLNIPFRSEMVSNGYLFDHNLVKHAKSCWHLDLIQITLDGTEDVYNHTKAYITITDNAYRRVLRNIQLFLDEGINVNIRLNMDNHNDHNLEMLIDELADRFKGEKRLAVYVRLLKENAGFSPIKHTADDKHRLRDRYLRIQNRLEKNGWSQIWRFEIPRLRTFSCMADNPCAIQCTPDGILGKCEDHIYDHTVGTLLEGVTKSSEIDWWKQRITLKDCPGCVLYPSCVHLLKHCPTRFTECDLEEKHQRIQLCYIKMIEAYEKWKDNNSKA